MNYAERSESGRRMSGLMVVLLLHVVVIYALVHGLARKIVDVVRNPLETKIVEEVKPPPDKPPPPPPPRLAQPPPPFIPTPEVNIQALQTAPTITAVTTVKPPEPVPPPAAPPAPPPPAAPPRVPVRVGAVVLAKDCEKPVYPAASIRANESGVVLLNMLIDLDGRVLDSKVERSSGHRRLDEAARQGLGLCKFKPATVDGKPEKTWSRIEYEWRIE